MGQNIYYTCCTVFFVGEYKFWEKIRRRASLVWKVTEVKSQNSHSLTGYSHWKSIQSLKHCPCWSLILIFFKKRRNALLWKLVLSYIIVWLFLRLLRNCLRKYCLWFVFDRELENISRSEVFPCGRSLVRLVIEHLEFEDIHGWHCCTFDEFSTHDGVDINMCMFSKMYDTNMNFWR